MKSGIFSRTRTTILHNLHIIAGYEKRIEHSLFTVCAILYFLADFVRQAGGSS